MKKQSSCPFCAIEVQEEIIAEKPNFFLKYDRYPVSDGHLLLIPKRHIVSFIELKKTELSAFFELMKDAQAFLRDTYSPDGFNVGINQGKAAGQTIEHLHIHIIPRYKGDVENPAGGIRKVIPNKVFYPIP